MAIAANIVIVLLELYGLGISLRRRGWQMFVFYTQLSNLAALLSSAAFLLFGAAAAPARYLAACMLVMTFLVTTLILVPMGGGARQLLFSGSGLIFHTICPILSVVSYVLLEPHANPWPVPVALTFVYGMVMLALNGAGRVDGPYPFFRVRHQSAPATVAWIAALTVMITLIALAVRRLAGTA